MPLASASRREFLAATGLAAAAALPGARALAAVEPAALAEQAFIWGVPLVLTGRYLGIAEQAGLARNQFYLSPDLATPKTRAIGPNVDTLYGLGWLDLSQGPQVIEVPDTADRYYSVQLLDAWANSFGYIGRRTTGTKAGAFAITPPGYQGAIPAGVTRIEAPTTIVLAFLRTLVRGDADLPAARAIHSAYSLGSLADYPNGRRTGIARAESINVIPRVDLSGAGAGYFGELNGLLASYPPLPEDRANLAGFAPLGVGQGEITASQRQLLADAVPAGLARVTKADFSIEANGWRTKRNVVPFIRDPLLRAATNLYGPGTHIAQEALYLSARKGPDGAPLTGDKRYRLRFPAGQLPPVDAFWSIGLYDRNLFLYDNVANRYSITDRTQGLRYGADGSLEILIQHEPPADRTNWLPAPPDGFALTIRTYQPRPEILDGRYSLPPLALA